MYEETKSHHSSRVKGRGRGRGKKKQAVEADIKMQESISISEGHFIEQGAITLDLDADITQLEAPTFSTINKGPPEPMLRLSWDHKTHLIGEKVINPMIHCCDKCEAPILVYGRMIPCKHVFCLACAECDGKICPRCKEKIVRIEKTGLGSVFLCTFGGTRYGNTGCRRTYLSQRDLQAHINHRHVTGGTAVNKDNLCSSQATLNMKPLQPISCRVKPLVTYHTAAAGDPRVHTNNNEYFHKIHHSPSSHTSSSSQQSRQSHHHSVIAHQPEQQQQTLQNSGSSHQQFSSLQTASSQRHVPSNPQLMQGPADFVNQMMMPSYMQNNASRLNSAINLNSNLISIHAHESNTDAGGSSMTLAPRGSNFHHAYSPHFSQASSPSIPFTVPPLGHPPLNTISQTQYFSNTPSNTHQSTTPRGTVPQFSANPAAQSVNQHPTMPTSTSTFKRPPFSSDSVIQPYPVPPPHRWPQPSQSNRTHLC